MNLSDFDCSKCTVSRRQGRGCHGDRPTPYLFERKTHKCPQRHVLDNPEIAEVFRRYRLNDGKMLHADFDSVTPQMVDAFGIIADAKLCREEEANGNK